MVLTITETIVVRCECKQTSLNELRAYCSSIGVTTTQQPEFTVLTQKLKTRRSALRPLLNCDGLETIFSGVETLGKQSLQHLSTQHNLDVDLGRDSVKRRLPDYVHRSMTGTVAANPEQKQMVILKHTSSDSPQKREH